MSNSLSLVCGAETSRRRYPVEYKRQVVQESMVAGASIARVALSHGLNANQLHNWRWQYRRGDFGSITQGPILMPVQIRAAPAVLMTQSPKPAKIIDGQAVQPELGQIELEFAAGRVVIHGAPDVSTILCVIEALRA